MISENHCKREKKSGRLFGLPWYILNSKENFLKMLLFFVPFTDFFTVSVVAMQHVHPANGSRAFGRVEQQFGLMCVKRWGESMLQGANTV